MGKARAIVRRRKAVLNIRKITRTMQLIATARFQQTYVRAVATRPYSDKITELVRELAAQQQGQLDHPLLRVNEGAGRSVLLVITSNRGLCGGYNSRVIRTGVSLLRGLEAGDAATGRPAQAVDLHVSGKKGIAYARYLGRAMAASYTQFEDKPQFAQVEPIADEFIRRYTDREIDNAYVVYTRFVSTAAQEPEVLRLLPMQQPGADQPQDEEAVAEPTAVVQYDFSPPPAELLAELLPAAVKTQLFQCFVDAAVSEQIARKVAMKAATDAADDMIKQLSQAYNRARQTQITLELLDIVAGAEALK
jgi:F-type H+-transporting ATPase subunit gamma